MTNEILCIIILITACIIALLALWYKIQKDGLRATVVELIVYAESHFIKGENSQKMDYVIDQITKILPMPIRFFVTTNSIKQFVQCVFDEVKKALDYREE